MGFEISMSSDGGLAVLNENEMVLNQKTIEDYFKNEIINALLIKKENDNMSKQVPSKNSYESALETVKQYEKRQSELKYVQKELSFKLAQFSQLKFKIDKNNGEIIFAGVHKKTNKLLLTKTVCSKQDVFNENIGKLISVKKALQEDIADVVKLVESKPYNPCISGLTYKGIPVTPALTKATSIY